LRCQLSRGTAFKVESSSLMRVIGHCWVKARHDQPTVYTKTLNDRSRVIVLGCLNSSYHLEYGLAAWQFYLLKSRSGLAYASFFVLFFPIQE
jgi:hypothetical protein